MKNILHITLAITLLLTSCLNPQEAVAHLQDIDTTSAAIPEQEEGQPEVALEVLQDEQESDIPSIRSASGARSQSSKSTSRRESETKKFAKLGIEDKTRMLLEVLYDSDECIYFSTDRFFKKLRAKKPARAEQIIQEFIRLQQKHKAESSSQRAAHGELTGNKLYGSILLIWDDKSTGAESTKVIPIKNRSLAVGGRQRIDEDVKEVRNILGIRYQTMSENFNSLELVAKDLEQKIKSHTVVGDEILWAKLNVAINEYTQQYPGKCEAINKKILLDKISSLKTYGTLLQNYINNPWGGFITEMGYYSTTREQQDAIKNLKDLIINSVIDVNKLESWTKMKAELKILEAKLKNLQNLAPIENKDIAIARGHSESVLLENMDFDEEAVKAIKGNEFKRAYILLLSTNVICSACTNVIPAIREKLVAKLKEVGGEITASDIDLLYLPIKDQGVKEEDESEEKREQDSIIGNVVVKCNVKEENYKRNSDSITSVKQKNESLAILFDKAFGSDIHSTHNAGEGEIEMSKSDNFEALPKESLGKTYAEDKMSQKGKGKSHKSGSSSTKKG